MNYLQLSYWSFNSPVMSLGVFSISILSTETFVMSTILLLLFHQFHVVIWIKGKYKNILF